MKRLILIFLFFCFNSCFDQNDCLITSTNLVKIELDNLSGTPLLTKFISVQKGDSTGHFPGYENTFITELALPLDPDQSQTSFNFALNDSVQYHLTLSYSTFSRVISTDCGAFLYFNNLSVIKSQTTFDSTRVITSQLFTSVRTNLKIFF